MPPTLGVGHNNKHSCLSLLNACIFILNELNIKCMHLDKQQLLLKTIFLGLWCVIKSRKAALDLITDCASAAVVVCSFRSIYVCM